jgi:hypothetical protein
MNGDSVFSRQGFKDAVRAVGALISLPIAEEQPYEKKALSLAFRPLFAADWLQRVSN